MPSWLESLKQQILGQDRSILWEGASGAMRLSGSPTVERLLDETVRLSKGALDRSTRNLIDKERLQAAANRIEIHLRVGGRDRAIGVQEAIDGMELSDELSTALTDYVAQQQYVVWKGRVCVPSITVEESPEGVGDEIQVRWRRDKSSPAQPPPPVPEGERPSREQRAVANRPADAAVLESGRKTQHSGEGISQPFTLWVKDRDDAPKAHPVMTPFYFGRNTRNLQFPFDVSGEQLISGEHFSILYLPDLGYVLRDNKSTNGTLVIRGDEAVRLATPPDRRETEPAKEFRLKPGDVVRLERGTTDHRGAVQFAFTMDDALAETLEWADSLSTRGVQWRDACEWVAQRVPESEAPTAIPEEYTLMIGECWLGVSVTGSIWVAYGEHDSKFADGRALAMLKCLSRCSLTWLAGAPPATLNGRPLVSNEAAAVAEGSLLEFETRDPERKMRVRFLGMEDHGRSSV